jgi:hypothetical protein
MNLWITGGSGFVGRFLTGLSAPHHTITWIGRTPPREKVPFLRWDEDWSNVSPPDVLIHLAGDPINQGRWTVQKKQRIYDSRVTLTQALIKKMADAKIKPRKLISASAIGFYGDRQDQELPETASIGQGFLAETCAAWENAAFAAQSQGISVCVVRIGMVLGPAGGALAALLPLFRLGLGGPLGHGKQWVSWIHLEDLCRLFLHLMTSEATGVFNGTAPQPVTNQTLTRTLGMALHRPAVLPAPCLALRVLLGAFATVLCSSQRCQCQATLDTGFTFCYPELSLALQSLIP